MSISPANQLRVSIKDLPHLRPSYATFKYGGPDTPVKFYDLNRSVSAVLSDTSIAHIQVGLAVHVLDTLFNVQECHRKNLLTIDATDKKQADFIREALLATDAEVARKTELFNEKKQNVMTAMYFKWNEIYATAASTTPPPFMNPGGSMDNAIVVAFLRMVSDRIRSTIETARNMFQAKPGCGYSETKLIFLGTPVNEETTGLTTEELSMSIPDHANFLYMMMVKWADTPNKDRIEKSMCAPRFPGPSHLENVDGV